MKTVTFEKLQALANHLGLTENFLTEAIATYLEVGVEPPLPTEPGTMFRARRRNSEIGDLEYFIITNRNSVVCFGCITPRSGLTWSFDEFSDKYEVVIPKEISNDA